MKLKTWASWAGWTAIALVAVAAVAIYFSIVFSEPTPMPPEEEPPSLSELGSQESMESQASQPAADTTTPSTVPSVEEGDITHPEHAEETDSDLGSQTQHQPPEEAVSQQEIQANQDQPPQLQQLPELPQPPQLPQLPTLPTLPASASRLVVYFEKKTLPKVWVDTWQNEHNARLDQRLLPTSTSNLPQDGDLYSVSPYYFGALSGSIKWESLRPLPPANPPFPKNSSSATTSASPASSTSSASSMEADLLTGIDACFRAHSFDPDNISTIPWRWTPYLLMVAQPGSSTSQSNGNGAKPNWPTEWWKEPKAQWPDLGAQSWDFLVAMRLKEQPMSIHSPAQKALWGEIQSDLKQSIPASSFKDEEALLAEIQDQKLPFTFLPASMRLWHILNFGKVDHARTEGYSSPIQWLAPPKGTLIQFEFFAVPEQKKEASEEDRKKHALALSLMRFLLHADRQKEMTQETGYFPVRGDVRQIMKSSPMPLPAGNWFDRSEYLLFEARDAAPAPPTPATANPPAAAAASSDSSSATTQSTQQTPSTQSGESTDSRPTPFR